MWQRLGCIRDSNSQNSNARIKLTVINMLYQRSRGLPSFESGRLGWDDVGAVLCAS